MKQCITALLLFAALLAAGCSSDTAINREEKKTFTDVELRQLESARIYEMNHAELDAYIGYLQRTEPDLRKRIIKIAKQNLNQPYNMYLLGEYPFEIYDPQPLFNLSESDCVVFCEHTYAMALSSNWKMFFSMLQRIRYKNGEIGMLTRNHYTEADWTVNNDWLVKNIDQELVGSKVKPVQSHINRAAFFKQHKIGQDIPVQKLDWEYIPASEVPEAIKGLKSGDFVNVVRGSSPDNVYVGHTGIISVENDGTVNLIHSTDPQVKIQTVLSYMEESLALSKKRETENRLIDEENEVIRKENEQLRAQNDGKPHPDEKKLKSKKPYFYGFRFYRLQDNAMENLKKIDGERAPKTIIYGQ